MNIGWGRSLDDWYLACSASEQRSIARRVDRWRRTRERVAGAVLVLAVVAVAVKW